MGYDVVVADTVNHSLRGVRLSDGRVTTVAGTGRQWMPGDPVPADSDPSVPLSSPWDVAWSTGVGEVVVAMAGIHRRHPDYSERQVFLAWARLNLGDALVRAAWPACELVDP